MTRCKECGIKVIPGTELCIPCDTEENQRVKSYAAEINQAIKQTKNKLMLEHVPLGILKAIGEVRTNAITNKYPDPNNWRQVPPQYFRGALLRHLVEYMADPKGVAEDTGIKHLYHMACNLAFLIEFDMEGLDD